MYFPFEENVDSLLLRRGQPRRGRIPPSAGSRKRLRGEKFPVRRTLRLHRAHTPLCECVRVEVRQRAIVRPAREGANSIITWECLCFLAHCRERERERKERVCVCVCVCASLPLVSFHSYFSFLCKLQRVCSVVAMDMQNASFTDQNSRRGIFNGRGADSESESLAVKQRHTLSLKSVRIKSSDV